MDGIELAGFAHIQHALHGTHRTVQCALCTLRTTVHTLQCEHSTPRTNEITFSFRICLLCVLLLGRMQWTKTRSDLVAVRSNFTVS